jgi:peptide/nickel transport system permease protein
MAVCAPLLAPHDPEKLDIRNCLAPPAWAQDGTRLHLLGTDQLGRDVLSRVLFGSRISLIVGFTTVLLGGTLGTTLGVLAGYWGGWFEALVMRLVDIQLAFPAVLFAIAFMAVLGPSLRNVVLVLSLVSWAKYCRVAYAQALSLRESEFVLAARAVGAGSLRIVFRHILVNALSPLIVVASFGVATNIINEASLSFLGIGVPPTIPTWGGMLGQGREYIRLAWWFSTFPGIALMLTVFGVNALGDWLRDYLDPRLRIV